MGDDAYVYWTFGGQDEVYARFYCYFHTAVPASWFFFMKFKDTSGSEMLILDIDFDIPIWGNVLFAYCGGEAIWYNDAGVVDYQSDRWYCFETRLKRHSTEGIIQVWVNNVLVIDEQNIDTQNAFDQIGRAEFGVMNDLGGTTIYFDNVCIDDERIYCDAASGPPHIVIPPPTEMEPPKTIEELGVNLNIGGLGIVLQLVGADA